MTEPQRPSVLWRVLGFLVFLLGGAGLVLCAAGVFYTWMWRTTLTQGALHASERADRLLAVGTETLNGVQAGLEEARASLDSLTEAARTPAGAEPAGPSLRQRTMRMLVEGMTGRLHGAQQTLAMVVEMSVVADNVLQGLEETPLVETGRVDPEQMRDLADQLGGLVAEARKLQDTLDTPQQQAMLDQTSRVRAALPDAIAAVEELARRVSRVQADMARIHDSLPRWLTLTSVGITVALFWIALGQLSLLVHGWKWLTARQA